MSSIIYRSEDIYDRWPVATAISRVIASSPLSWSTRIGLFGQWGDGKTSVLNLLEMQQIAAGNIVIRFSPWGASSEDEIWRGFTHALRRGLKKVRRKLPLTERCQYFFRRNTPWISGLLDVSGKIANGKTPGISAGTTFAANLIEKHVKPSRKDAQAMAEVLSDRRVIVLIDDLDRTDPKVIPKLLLALRDLLDFSKFTFVLAFDHSIVAKAISSHNPAWQNSESFLDKIIDFPFDLPAPTPLQVERLARDQFAKLCPFVPSPALNEIIGLIPANPRRLKLLGRVIASTKVEAARHAVDEINWRVAIIFAMLRLECSQLATELLEMSIDIDSSESTWLHWALLSKEDREAKTKVATDDLIKKHNQIHNSPRLGVLIRAWRDAIPSISGEGLRYQAMFTITPQSITWGEFRCFLASWRKDKSREGLVRFVNQRVASSAQPASNVAAELADASISYYATTLERAAQVHSQVDHLAIVTEAADVLDMSRAMFVDMAVHELAPDLLLPAWMRLHSVVLQWLHFNANPGEVELRAKESQLLADFAQKIPNPLEVYDALRPWEEEESFWGQREAELKTAFSGALQAAVLEGVCNEALALVEVPGQLKQLRKNDPLALKYLLCSPDSPMFVGERKERLLTALAERKSGPYAAEDASDYLGAQLAALQHKDPICDADSRQKFIKDHPDFFAQLWSLVVSRPSQFRGLSALRGQRDSLIAAGMDSKQLLAPEWLDAPRAPPVGP